MPSPSFAGEDDHTAALLRAAWQQGTLFDDFASELSKLTGSVGTGGANSRADNAKVQSLLERAGQLDLAKTQGPTGYGMMTLENGIARFQRDQGLKVDGRVDPGGPTIQKLAEVTRLGQRRIPVAAPATVAPAPTRRPIQGAGTRLVSGQQVIEPPALPPPTRMTKIGRSPSPNGGGQTVPPQVRPRRDWKGIFPKYKPLQGTVFFGGAGMEGAYVSDMVDAFSRAGMSNVRAADPVKWSKGIISDALDVRTERYRDNETSDFSSFKSGPGQLNLVGYSYGALEAAQGAADLADQGRKVDHLVLIGGPISKDFLNQLKSNPNIGKVIVIDLTEHGDKIYAGMSDSALMGAVPKTGVDFARGSISEKNGHFYYSDDGPEGKKRRNALAQRLFNEGLR